MELNNNLGAAPNSQEKCSNIKELRLVNVYFRLPTKIGIKILMPSQIEVKELSAIIQN